MPGSAGGWLGKPELFSNIVTLLLIGHYLPVRGWRELGCPPTAGARITFSSRNSVEIQRDTSMRSEPHRGPQTTLVRLAASPDTTEIPCVVLQLASSRALALKRSDSIRTPRQ